MRGRVWVSASATLERDRNAGVVSPAAAFEDALGRVGAFAATHGTGLLIAVDEAQAVPAENLSVLARALQPVVARRLQPIAVVFTEEPLRSATMSQSWTSPHRGALTLDGHESKLDFSTPTAQSGAPPGSHGPGATGRRAPPGCGSRRPTPASRSGPG